MSDPELSTKLALLLQRVEELTVIVKRHELLLYGDADGDFGLVHQVRIIWRFHVWVLCTLSAAIGSAVTALGAYFWK